MAKRDVRRVALREFLMSRRARLSPLQLGMSAGRRRRLTGLSRDEVSALAGISVEWYTRIEQGRVDRVSPQTIDRLSAGLRLDYAEREYLRDLLGEPHRPSGAPVHSALAAALASDAPIPLIVSTRYFTPIVWNRTAGDLFAIPDSEDIRERNLFVRLIAGREHMGLSAHLDELTMLAAAAMRRVLAFFGPTPEFDMLFRELALVPAFRKAWEANLVDRFPTPTRFLAGEALVLARPGLAPIAFRPSWLPVQDQPEYLLGVHLPVTAQPGLSNTRYPD